MVAIFCMNSIICHSKGHGCLFGLVIFILPLKALSYIELFVTKLLLP